MAVQRMGPATQEINKKMIRITGSNDAAHDQNEVRLAVAPARVDLERGFLAVPAVDSHGSHTILILPARELLRQYSDLFKIALSSLGGIGYQVFSFNGGQSFNFNDETYTAYSKSEMLPIATFHHLFDGHHDDGIPG